MRFPIRTIVVATALLALPAQAQIQRNPTGVNVNATGATTVFITFGGLEGYVPVEALWCGEIEPASPDVGDRCVPGTVFGSLPVRLDQSRFSGDDGFTDIMSIPPSVARRAFQAAIDGDDSRFFYVRRFVDPNGFGPDQYVTVTCRMTGGGARTPLSIVDVQLGFATDDAVLAVEAGVEPPPLEAMIRYTGTGRLVGRWEVVLPGEEPPTDTDLLTEATLPGELRGTQRRYTELSRFNVFLPPTGEYVLPGPPVEEIPNASRGLYQILLRIEASDDKEADSNLTSVGTGEGVLAAGAVAGFPIPPLRYFVGDAGGLGVAGNRLQLLTPEADGALGADAPFVFTWMQTPSAILYRVEFRDMAEGEVLSAIVQPGSGAYTAPPWLLEEASDGLLEWRVRTLDGEGEVTSTTPWRVVRLGGEG